MTSMFGGGGGGGLHVFTIGGIPVRVSLWYGLLLLFWFQRGLTPENLIWAAVVTLSILFHEFGHALVARYYGLRPQILLHGLGGLCAHDRAERDRHDVFIIAAGPGFGLILGLVTWIISTLFGEAIGPYGNLAYALRTSLYVNFWWSLVNLVPLWPLDGGQLFRIFMLKLMRPMLAERITHGVGLVLLTLVGIYLLRGYSGGSLMLILILWLGWANVKGLRAQGASGPIRTTSAHAKSLLAMAKTSLAEEDFSAAARYCYRIREESNVHPKVLRECWSILGVSSARLGEHKSALHFLSRAPISADVIEAKVECLHALSDEEGLDELLASDDFEVVPRARRDEILSIVRPDD